jgi:hypothetical protein
MGEKRTACRFMVGKSEGKRPQDQDLAGWIILLMDFRQIGWGGVNLIYLAQDRDECKALVNKVINL